MDRTLKAAEREQMLAEMNAFLERWTAHNEALLAGSDLRYGRFLMAATDEAQASASGCSIDELYRRVRMLGETFGVEFASNLNVFYRDSGGAIRSASRAEFAALATKGEVSGETIVFDNGVATVGALRAGKWEQPARESWHAALVTGNE